MHKDNEEKNPLLTCQSDNYANYCTTQSAPTIDPGPLSISNQYLYNNLQRNATHDMDNAIRLNNEHLFRTSESKLAPKFHNSLPHRLFSSNSINVTPHRGCKWDHTHCSGTATAANNLINSLCEHVRPLPRSAFTASLKPVRELERKIAQDQLICAWESGANVVVSDSDKAHDQSSKENTSLTASQLWIIFALIYGNFWVSGCVSLQAPFFPKEAEMKGASPTQYGLVFGIYELMILITSPIFGTLVTRYSAISICKNGLFWCGTSTMIFGLIDRVPSGWPFISLAYAIRVVEGISASAFMTASYTIMAAKFPTRVASTFSYLEMAYGVGLIVGPTLGGALYELGGFIYPFLTLGAFLLAGYFVVHILLTEPKDIGDSKDELKSINIRTDKSTTKFIFDRNIIFDVMSIVTALNFIGFNGATLEPHLRQFNLGPFLTGLVFIINGAIYALSTPLWGKLCDANINPKLLIMIGSLLCSVGLIFLGPLSFVPIEPSLPLVVFSLILIGLGMSAKLVCSFIDALNDSIQRRGFPNDISTYGLVSAMFFTSCSIGAFVGPSVGGFLLDTLQYRRSTIPVLLVDVFMTLYSIYFLCTTPKQR